MSPSELTQIESSLSFSLPNYYRETMLAYPFTGRMDIEQAELLNSSELLLAVNHLRLPEMSEPIWIVGTDQSELTYYIKLGTADSAVYSFDLELRKHRRLFGTWSEYLLYCSTLLEEAEHQKRVETTSVSKKWWQLW
jgi:hypothetical protein